VPGGVVEVDGTLNLSDVEEVSALELPDGPYETIAGFVISRLGRLPVAGDVVEVDGYRLAVTETDRRRIARVQITAPLPRSDAAADAAADVAARAR
jgi:putative hemolysin